MVIYLDIFLTILLAASAFALVRVRDLFAVVALLAVYSAVISVLYGMSGAVDVAFTEAVVGTGVSTVFLMALFTRVDPYKLTHHRGLGRQSLAIAMAGGVGLFLLYGVHGLPEFGSPEAPATVYLSPEYVANSLEDMATPNVVTAVLADYRGFDTLIETSVVLTAALACLLVLGRSHERAT